MRKLALISLLVAIVGIVGVAVGCGGQSKYGSAQERKDAVAVAAMPIESWKICTWGGEGGPCGSSIEEAQSAADEIVNSDFITTVDKRMLLNRMLDWADANAPECVDSIQRRLSRLG